MLFLGPSERMGDIRELLYLDPRGAEHLIDAQRSKWGRQLGGPMQR